MNSKPQGSVFPILNDAVNAVKAIAEDKGSLDDCLDHLQHPELRRTIANLLFAYYRHKVAIDGLSAKYSHGALSADLAAILPCGVTMAKLQTAIAPEVAANAVVEYAKQHLSKAKAGFVNAILRRVLADTEVDLNQSPLPDELLKVWSKRFNSTKIAELTALLHTPAPFVCRSVKTPLSESELQTCNGTVLPVDNLTHFNCYTCSPERLLNSDLLAGGRVYIQDPAPLLIGEIWAKYLPKDAIKQILDLCSAPGGKALMAQELWPQAFITAADRSLKRQQLTRENFATYHVNGKIIAADASQAASLPEGVFDLVIADVPCSNTGVFRRRPDALYKYGARYLRDLHNLQRDILQASAAKVANDGFLSYSTCSIEPEENQLMIMAFCNKNANFKLLKQQLFLPDLQHDGTFVALLQRIK